MYDFELKLDTKILFGRGHLDKLAGQIKKYGARILLVYEEEVAKNLGLYQDLVEIFQANDIYFEEYSQVTPNPRVHECQAGADLVRDKDLDFILAVGGGSVMDASKLMAVAAFVDDDPWKIVTGEVEPTKAIPIGMIPTLAATGSEMNTSSVITNEETMQKLGWGHDLVMPKFAILNPEYTFTVPRYHTAAGVADTMSHTMECYFSLDDGAYLQDRFAEALLDTCIHYGPIALDEPDNYEGRANLMWSGTWAINGLIRRGKNTDWSCHAMEHELSAMREITHGVGLAIITPNWLEYSLNDRTKEKIAGFAYRIFGVEKSGDIYQDAREGIQALRNFFNSLGLPSTLKEEGFEREDLPKLAADCAGNLKTGQIDGFITLRKEDMLKIYEMSFE